MTGDPETQVAGIVATASAAAGRALSDPAELSAGDWSVVLRCRDVAAGRTVIVKAYPPTSEGAASFSAEAAGLEFASSAGSGLAPEFLAADPGRQVVVMSDLGAAPSLADALLGDSPDSARSALLQWAIAAGRLAVAGRGRRREFDALKDRYLAGRPDERHSAGLPARVLAAAEQAATVGVRAPAGLEGELRQVTAATESGAYAVFSPGDICPDNNLMAPAGIRFVDFEEAGYHSALLDAAYIRMPFSTCWCVFRLPAELRAAAEDAYREQACLAWPELADDTIWQPGIRRAVAAWTLSSTSWLLSRSLAADAPMNADQVSPRTRQLMRYRWQSLLAELEPAGELAAVASLMRSLLAATTGWQAPELPLYPAFRVR